MSCKSKVSVSKHHKCYYKNSSWQHQNSLKEMAKNGESLERKNYKWAITSSMGTLPQSHSPSKKLCKVSSAKRGVKKQWPCRKSIFLNGQMLLSFSLHRFASMVQWLHKQILTALYNTWYTPHMHNVVLLNLWNRNKWLHPVKWKPSVRRTYWDFYLWYTYTLV